MPQTKRDILFAGSISDEDDTGEALDEILDDLAEQLDGRQTDLALVFATQHHQRGFTQIANRLERDLSPRVSLGVTAGGVLGQGSELEGRAGISILAGRLDGAWVRPFNYGAIDWQAVREDPQALRQAILGEHADETDPAAMLLFPDPFSTPMIKLMPLLNAALPGVPVIGGMASGGREAGENRLLLNGSVFRQGAVGVVIGGPIRVDCTVSQGCRPIGQPWVITQARHNIIQQIGGRAVLQVLQEMAEQAEPDIEPLMRQGIFVGRVIDEYKPRFGRGDFLVRNIMGADQENGYIAVSDFVRVGQTIQFHVRDAQTALEDLRLLLESQKLHGPAAGTLLCTCNGRGRHLFEESNVESNLIREALGDAPMAGFFAAGEIGPIGRQNFVHGFTASMAVFRPAEDESVV